MFTYLKINSRAPFLTKSFPFFFWEILLLIIQSCTCRKNSKSEIDWRVANKNDHLAHWWMGAGDKNPSKATRYCKHLPTNKWKGFSTFFFYHLPLFFYFISFHLKWSATQQQRDRKNKKKKISKNWVNRRRWWWIFLSYFKALQQTWDAISFIFQLY